MATTRYRPDRPVTGFGNSGITAFGPDADLDPVCVGQRALNDVFHPGSPDG